MLNAPRYGPADAPPGFRLEMYIFGTSFLALVVLIGLFNLPAGGAFVQSHDFLDSFFPFYVIRSELGGFFFDFEAMVPALVGGLPLNALAIGDLHLGANLYLVFEPFVAHFVNFSVIHIAALVGMYLLLRDYVLPRTLVSLFIAAVIAFSFAVIPHAPPRFGTVTLVPLLAWAGLNIWTQRPAKISWLVIAAYPFYATLPWGGFTVCGWFLLATIYAYATGHTARRPIALAAALLIGLFVVVEVRLFYHWFFASYEYESNRPQNFVQGRGFSVKESFEYFVAHFGFGGRTRHFSFHFPGPIVGIIGALVFYALSTFRRTALTPHVRRVFALLAFVLLLLFLTSLFVAVVGSNQLLFAVTGLPLDLTRSDVVSPTLWWVAFALSIYLLLNARYRIVSAVLVPLFLILVTAHTTFQFPGLKESLKEAMGVPQNVGFRALVVAGIRGRGLESLQAGGTDQRLTLSQNFFGTTVKSDSGRLIPNFIGRYHLSDYFALQAFEEIDIDLEDVLSQHKSSYRVLSVGISPSVAMFHGYNALGGTFFDFPAAYSDEWLEIFSGEYDKDGVDPKSQGLLAYVAEQGRGMPNVNLAYDMCQFRNMGGRVILSRFEIDNDEELFLNRIGDYNGIKVYTSADPGCPLED